MHLSHTHTTHTHTHTHTHTTHTHTQMHQQHTLATLQLLISRKIVHHKGFKNEKICWYTQTNTCMRKHTHTYTYTHTHTHTTIIAATIYSFCYIFYSLLCYYYYLLVFMCIPMLRAISEKTFCCNVFIQYCVH